MFLTSRSYSVSDYFFLFLSFLGYSFIITLSFIVGYILTLIPGSIWSLPIFYPLELRLPAPFNGLNHYDWLNLLQYLKPQWTLLLVIYWSLARPQVMGIVGAWLAGVVLDVLQVGLIGEYALVFTLICYLTLISRERMISFSPLQQMLSVFILLATAQLLVLWIQASIGHPPHSWAYWWSSVMGALLWPLLVKLLGQPKLRAN